MAQDTTATNADSFSAHTHIVIIAVNDYHDQAFAPLSGPTVNATRLKAVLTASSGCSVPGSQVKAIPQNASPKETLDLIQTCAQALCSNDVLIVYFCGHGIVHEDEFYLCLQNSSPTNLSDTGISGKALDLILQGSKAKGILLIIDCCRAGSLARCAPSIFRDARQGDFRILMSSSGADEVSWDLGESGTLFSRYLIRALDGKEPIKVQNPGLIYLSDLLKFIQSSIEEDQESHASDVSPQIPRLVGFHAIDPLLFVHRRLTFQQISLQTLRYSREYVRRRIRRFVLVGAAIGLFLFGTIYAILERQQFIRTESSELVLYEGNPHIRLLDLPRKLRVLDLPPAVVLDSSPLHHEGGVLTAKVGGNVTDEAFRDVNPQVVWFSDSVRGDLDKAFPELKRSLLQGFEPPPYLIPAAKVLIEEKMSEADIPDFRKIATFTNGRICFLAWLGLSKQGILPRPNEIGALAGPSSYYLGNLVVSLHGSCTTAKKEFLATVIAGGTTAVFGSSYSSGILAALTLGCKFTSKELAGFRLRTAFMPYASLFRDDDLSMLSFITDPDGFRDEMMEFLRSQDPNSGSEEEQRNIRTVLTTLAIDPEHKCSKEFERFLNAPSQTQPAAIFLLFRNCGRDDPKLKEPQLRTGLGIPELVRAGVISESELLDRLKSPTDSWTEASALRSVRLLHNLSRRDEFISAIVPLLGRDDQTIKSTTIAALTFLGYRGEAVVPFTKGDIPYLALGAYWWLKQKQPDEERTLLFNRIGTLEDLATADLLASDRPLSQEEKQRLFSIINGSEWERNNAGCLLALYGDIDEQVEVLHAGNLNARGSARSCAVYAPNFDEIVSRLNKSGKGDALTVALLRQEHEYIKACAARFAQLPAWAQKWAVLLFSWSAMRPGLPNLAFQAKFMGPRDWWIDDTPQSFHSENH